MEIAVALDADSRTRPAGFAAKQVLEAARAVRESRLVCKKLDSTLRGNVAAELFAALGTTRRGHVVVAPAFPAASRTTVVRVGHEREDAPTRGWPEIIVRVFADLHFREVNRALAVGDPQELRFEADGFFEAF
jgi:Sugar-binding N-terminal domain